MAKAKSAQPDAPKSVKPKTHERLAGMNIRVNEFGEIIRDYDVDDINAFLNETVKDKKFASNDEPESDC